MLHTGFYERRLQALLEHNAKVYMASRSPEKAKKAIEALKRDTGKEAVFLELDLASYASIHKAAAEFLRWLTQPVKCCSCVSWIRQQGTGPARLIQQCVST